MAAENLNQRPPAGLCPVEMAILGSEDATKRVVAIYPNLGERPPSGLSVIEMARIGLLSAIETVRETAGTP